MLRLAGLCMLVAIGIVLPERSPALAGPALIFAVLVLLGTVLRLEFWHARLPDFAIAGYCAVGAWCDASLAHVFDLPLWACLPIGSALSGLTALVLAPSLLKMRRPVFAVVTLGISALVQLFFAGVPAVVLRPGGGDPGNVLYYAAFAEVALIAAFASNLRRSAMGLVLRAMREDENACHSIGIDIGLCRQTVLVTAAGTAGLAGGLLVAAHGAFWPADYDFGVTANVFAVVMLGGNSQLGITLAALVIFAPSFIVPIAPWSQLIWSGVAILLRVLTTVVLRRRNGTRSEPAPAVGQVVGVATE